MQSCLILPSLSTGNCRQIKLAGIDLWITPRIDNVFVYPADLNINRLKEALSRTLSIWPLVAGRFLLLNNTQYIIEMSDNGIPFSFVENNELIQWPTNLNVVLDSAEGRLQMFIDEVLTNKLHHGSADEPLFRLKITHLIQSGEWTMGISWAHVLGDAYTCLTFLNTLSRLYQQLELLESLPVFERRLWNRENADQSLLPFMKHLTDALSPEQSIERSVNEQITHDQINIYFSGEQLVRLHSIADNSMFTIQDVMTAYIILTLNTHCFNK
ncbi:hypothetical protein I4U23_011119 [Adineta vaga]|nr:hypothetical protein I4U23_011119 [Adineta vaga]